MPDIIKFFKQHHAWCEFINEVQSQNDLKDEDMAIYEIGQSTKDKSSALDLLKDGNLFYYEDATREINWVKLDSEWRELWRELWRE